MKTHHRNGRKFRKPRPYVVFYWGGESTYEQMRRPVTDLDAAKLMTGEIGRYEGFTFIEGALK